MSEQTIWPSRTAMDASTEQVIAAVEAGEILGPLARVAILVGGGIVAKAKLRDRPVLQVGRLGGETQFLPDRGRVAQVFADSIGPRSTAKVGAPVQVPPTQPCPPTFSPSSWIHCNPCPPQPRMPP